MAKKIQVRLIMQLRDTGMAQTTIVSAESSRLPGG